MFHKQLFIKKATKLSIKPMPICGKHKLKYLSKALHLLGPPISRPKWFAKTCVFVIINGSDVGNLYFDQFMPVIKNLDPLFLQNQLCIASALEVVLTILKSCVCVRAQLCPSLCDPADCSPPGSSCPWDSPGKNPGVGCYFLLQVIFLTQRLNPCLLYLLH